jgi:phenylpropionate dioxygenase-like ring-hydroxylating dioxygenase large terminal subunit
MTMNQVHAAVDWKARRLAVGADLLRRMVAHIAAGGTTDMAAEPLSIDASVYTEAERFVVEKRALFHERPVLACLSGDIPQPGDTRLFEETGTPILIVRAQDGTVNAFLNMCMHRGAKLVTECTRRPVISCPFHAWSFSLDGKLNGVPGRAGFEGIDFAQRELIRVPVAEWNGMVFVRPAPGKEALDIGAHLGSFGPELAQLELADALPVKSGVLPAEANWKYVMDTYGESYHFAALHRDTIAPYFTSNIGCYEAFGRHYRLVFPSKAQTLLAGKPESEWPEAEYSALHFVFPNTMFFIGSVGGGKSYTQIFRLFPGDTVGETRVHFAVYAHRDDDSPAHREEVAQAYDATAHVVQAEDYTTASRAWANLAAAPPGHRVVLGRNEIALQDFQRNVAQVVGMPLP